MEKIYVFILASCFVRINRASVISEIPIKKIKKEKTGKWKGWKLKGF